RGVSLGSKLVSSFPSADRGSSCPNGAFEGGRRPGRTLTAPLGYNDSGCRGEVRPSPRPPRILGSLEHSLPGRVDRADARPLQRHKASRVAHAGGMPVLWEVLSLKSRNRWIPGLLAGVLVLWLSNGLRADNERRTPQDTKVMESLELFTRVFEKIN